MMIWQAHDNIRIGDPNCNILYKSIKASGCEAPPSIPVLHYPSPDMLYKE